jgi:glycosyltransferase involved in cell wall biosynthesis
MKPRLLVLSHVLPFPGESGQQQRVRNSLWALRERFHVTFATFSDEPIAARLEEHCDEAIVLPPLYARSRLRHGIAGRLHRLRTGLKLSNYVIGELEFAPPRVAALLEGRHFDCALFEYFHAARSTGVLRARGIPCVLDMHNVLAASFERHQGASPRAVRRYARQEERAWGRFDGLITINAAEDRYVRERARPDQSVWLAPMGLDLGRWPYAWRPASPPRLMYYGGLASAHNQQDALRCATRVMPRIWAEVPDAGFWIVGNRPPPTLLELARDERITVTGFVPEVQDVLRTATALLCPWSGTYGFRSRLVEAMALGVPVVTTPDAVDGMGLEAGRGLMLTSSDEAMAEAALELLRDPAETERQSRGARDQVERTLGFEATYGRLADDLAAFVRDRLSDRPA